MDEKLRKKLERHEDLVRLAGKKDKLSFIIFDSLSTPKKMGLRIQDGYGTYSEIDYNVKEYGYDSKQRLRTDVINFLQHRGLKYLGVFVYEKG